jgi:hypothetical protein
MDVVAMRRMRGVLISTTIVNIFLYYVPNPTHAIVVGGGGGSSTTTTTTVLLSC